MGDVTNNIIDKLSVEEQIRSCGFEPEKVGEGAYGTVFSVRDHEGIIYALKYVGEPLYQMKGFQGLQEIDILRRIEHPHIIHSPMIITSLSCKLEDSLAIIMPLADMTLSTSVFNNLYNIEVKLNIMYKLATAVEFLHRHNILHLDIKNPNVVLRGTEPYLIDFGLAMFVRDAKRGRRYNAELVTITNRPPEILESDTRYNAAVDVWSLGMVMLSLLTGKVSLFSNTVDWGVNQIVLQELEVIVEQLPELLSGINVKYRDKCLSLIKGMLTFDPLDRLTADEVTEHSLFDDIRTIIVGYINEPMYNPVYADDHRSILKIMLVWAQKVFLDSPAESLFLAIDIYNRAGTYYSQSTTIQRMALAAMSLIESMKLLDQPLVILSEYQISINELVPEITIKELLRAETEIIYYLDGILYRSPFFDKLMTGDELILTFSHIIMDRDSTLYLKVDYDAWAHLVKQLLSDNKYPNKDITIKQLLNI